jgi:hypothetical protein
MQHQNDDAADDRHEEASSDIIADRGLDPERISFVDRAVQGSGELVNEPFSVVERLC